jgi:hypothetical protein
MSEAATHQTTALCPKCRSGMILAAITPHPVATQVARNTYLCAACNQTKTYVLPVAAPADSDGGSDPSDAGDLMGVKPEDRRRHPRETLATPASIYHKDGSFLVPCVVRDLSTTGARIELFKEAALPQYFRLSLLPDGSGRRLCSKVWQIALIAGVRFAEKEAL